MSPQIWCSFPFPTNITKTLSLKCPSLSTKKIAFKKTHPKNGLKSLCLWIPNPKNLPWLPPPFSPQKMARRLQPEAVTHLSQRRVRRLGGEPAGRTVDPPGRTVEEVLGGFHRYPLVNIQKTMERSTMLSMGKSTISMLMASIAMLVITRGYTMDFMGKWGMFPLFSMDFTISPWFNHQKPWKMRENYGPFTHFFQSWRCSTWSPASERCRCLHPSPGNAAKPRGRYGTVWFSHPNPIPW